MQFRRSKITSKVFNLVVVESKHIRSHKKVVHKLAFKLLHTKHNS